MTQGYHLEFACNGAEALAMAAEAAPDLILLDVMMPGIDGFEVCRRIRADTRLAEIPIILVTALDDPASRLLGIEAGADDFVSKPIDRAELRARVRTVTRLNRYRKMVAERTRFEQLFALSPDGVMIVEGGLIRLANPALRHMLEAGDGEAVLGLPILSVVAPQSRDACSAWLDAILAEGRRTGPVESLLIGAGGTPFPAQMTAGRLEWDQAPALKVIVRDVTEQKKMQEQQLRSQRLESIGALAGGIAHDLNDPRGVRLSRDDRA